MRWSRRWRSGTVVVETTMPDDTTCPCCYAPMHEIGAEESQRLDVIPAQYRVIVTLRRLFVGRDQTSIAA